jgi:putative oxidoreductase
MKALQEPAILVARLLLAAIFLIESYGKITGYRDVAAYMESYGISARLLPLVILTELGGGLCVAFGLFARYAGFALFGFALLTALFFHRDFGDPDQMVHFMKNLAIAGGFLLLTAYGAGAWSLDAWRRRRLA